MKYIVSIVQSLSILIAFAAIYDYVWLHYALKPKRWVKPATGMAIGLITILIMNSTWSYRPGIVFDIRSIVLSLSGLFFGGIPTIIAVIISALYRLMMGGAGQYMGVLVIVSSGLIGYLWRRLRPDFLSRKRPSELLALGLLVHIVMLICTLALPQSKIIGTLKAIAPIVLTFYPLGTVLVGLIFFRREGQWGESVLTRESERKYRMLFEGNPQPMLIHDVDTYRIIEVNDAAIDLYGYKREEFLAKTILDIHPKEEIPGTLKTLKESAKLRYIKTADNIRHLTKSGEIIWVQILSHAINYNGIAAKHVLINDVTRLVQLNTELRDIKERYQNYIQLSSEAICLFELEKPLDTTISTEMQVNHIYQNAYIAECNQTFCDCYLIESPERAVGIRFGQIYPRLSRQNIEYLNRFVTSGYKMFGAETREVSFNGYIRYFLNSWSGITETGRLLRMWSSKRDISRLKETENEIRSLNAELEQRVIERTKQLTEANRELESFSYSVSHDLRAPLRAINGFTGILLEEYSNRLDSEGIRLCNVIYDNATRMGELIEGLLKFSRAGRASLNPVPIDMRNMITSVFNELSLNIPNDREITLNLGKIYDIPADPLLLKQVWFNLIGNSIKFTAKSKTPTITINSKQTENTITYSIEDNGIGFDMKYYDDLFGVFQQLHNDSDMPGTGVGLAIVKRIIDKHNGKIWAEGAPGKGAKFHFELPRMPITGGTDKKRLSEQIS